MRGEIINFIQENNLSPFNKYKTTVDSTEDSVYKTKDAKLIHNKLISKLAANFYFSDTSNIFNHFDFTAETNQIKKRQDFFKQITSNINSDFLSLITRPKSTWRPPYSIVVVTEEDKTFVELQKLGCPTKFLVNQYDLESLNDYDIVQVIDCENFSRALESLPQSVFIDSLDDVYLERYLESLSGWKPILELLDVNENSDEIKQIVSELKPLLSLLTNDATDKISKEKAEELLDKINEEVSIHIKQLTLSGDVLFNMLSKSTLPTEFQTIVKQAINRTAFPIIFNVAIPVKLDEPELDRLIKKQNAEEHTTIAEKIKKQSEKLQEIPEKLKILSNNIILFDFIAGISKFIAQSTSFPEFSNEFSIKESANLFIDKAQPISFHLNDNNRCSILTGANSGGKTTLLEHIIQLNSLFQLGLPVNGNITTPLFSEVYYFAKNKGSMNKGAFETLLTQMSKIKPGKQTLILADEIEAVTEPGVAGLIVTASAEYFIKQGCFLVIATHLGKEIQKVLPMNARIDGIEAKGLDENFELIVDHNPVLGRLAHSTPELIVEKMANSQKTKTEYFTYLHEYLKKDK